MGERRFAVDEHAGHPVEDGRPFPRGQSVGLQLTMGRFDRSIEVFLAAAGHRADQASIEGG